MELLLESISQNHWAEHTCISALGRLRQEDYSDLKANLAYIVTSLLKNTNTKEKREGKERKEKRWEDEGEKGERGRGRNERKSE